MKVRVSKGTPRIAFSVPMPFGVQTDTQLVVNAAPNPATVVAPALGAGSTTLFLVQAVNRSGGGQNIRIGIPLGLAFVPATGILLAVGDVYESPVFNEDGLSAIADGNGALLDVIVWIKIL